MQHHELKGSGAGAVLSDVVTGYEGAAGSPVWRQPWPWLSVVAGLSCSSRVANSVVEHRALLIPRRAK